MHNRISSVVLESIPAGILVIDPDRHIIYANKYAVRLLTLEKQDPSQKIWTCSDQNSCSLIEKVFSFYPLATDQHNISFEHDLMTKEKKKKLLSINLNFSEIETISGSSMIVEVKDITQQRQKEIRLRDSEEMYRTMFEHAGFGIALVDPQTRRRVAFNRKLHERLGYTREEYQKLALEDIAYDNDKDAIEKRMRSIFSTRAETFEEIHRTKDGKMCHVLVSAVPITIGGRDLVHAISLDITDRKKMEADLQAKTQELDQYFYNSLDLLCIADSKGVFRRLNPQWEKTLGYPASELKYQQIQSFVHQEDYAKVEQQLQTFQKEKGGTSFTCRYRSSNGEYKWLQWQAYSNKDLIYAAARDITQQVELEEQLRQAQKMEAVGRLAGGVAHDFNNMLNVILGYAEMGMLEVELDSSTVHCFKEIEKAANRSADLTRQLLAFSRKQMVAPQILRLDDTIGAHKNMLNRLIGEEISIRIISCEDLWHVKIDPTQIHQILVNLVVNAKDAIPGVGSIHITVNNISMEFSNRKQYPGLEPGDYVLLTVADDGQGIPSKMMEHIFEPFFTTKELGRGTGLGLSTVYGIVKQNLGWIDVESEAGKGTCFKIYLPRYEGHADLKERDESKKFMEGSETILVVEDEPQLLELSKMILEEYGYNVLAAETPDQACRLARQYKEKIHLLLTDVIMPQMDGKKLEEKIIDIKPNIKTLFMSGYASNYIAARGIADKKVPFIQKPFTLEELASRVRQVLDE